MNDVLVFGSEGQVSRSLKDYFPDANFINRSQCDLGHKEQIMATLEKFRPKIVINPAAYTQVDLAEDEPDKAFAINANAPGAISKWCQSAGASLIHFSTDYVFSGDSITPWEESDLTQPLCVYGASKRKGEEAIEKSGCHFYILRTSWVFSPFGKNFVKTMIALGQSRDEICVVADQIGAPTSALDLAMAIKQICDHPDFFKKSGIYHITNSGEVSWYGFAQAIFSSLREKNFLLKVASVEPIATSAYPTKAKRPLNSRLNNSKLKEDFSIELGEWRVALNEVLEQLLERH